MANASTYVRLLRHVGIALIFAPEPFTTPFGVACILAARHLSKRNEASLNSHVREMVQHYLTHTRRSTDYIDAEAGVPTLVKHRNSSNEPAILGQITGGHRFEAKSRVKPSGHDLRNDMVAHAADMQNLSRRCKQVGTHFDMSAKTEKVTHHTLNMDWLCHRFESAHSAVAHSSWASTTGAASGVAYHSFNLNLTYRHPRTGGVQHANAEDHPTNAAQLRRRHESSVDYGAVLNGLHNNNYYYDMLSKKNVVGGY